MSIPYEASGFRYSVCRTEDVAEMRRVLAAAFTHEDRLADAAGLLPDEYEVFVEAVSSEVVADQLTVVARDLATGNLAGALLNDDAARSSPSGQGLISDKFAPIAALFGQLGQRYRSGKRITPGNYLHLYLLGVDGAFRGRGIAQQLVSASLANGVAAGFRKALVEATNPTSQHIFSKSGFTARAGVRYDEFEFHGTRPFASIDEEGPLAMDRDLTPRAPAYGLGAGARE